MVSSLRKYIVKKLKFFKPSLSDRDERASSTQVTSTEKNEKYNVNVIVTNPNTSDSQSESTDICSTNQQKAEQCHLPETVKTINTNSPCRLVTRRSSHSRVRPVVSQPVAATKRQSSNQQIQVVRCRRLMREYREIVRQTSSQTEPMFSVELVNDCLFEWRVLLYKLDPSSDFYADMIELKVECVELRMTFPDSFPFAPPFVRVVSPRIERGFVMEGGSICLELLTPRGWASAYTVEAIIMQFAASLVKGQARIDRRRKKPKMFSRKLAENSFRGIVRTHEKYGWVTPPLSDG